MNSPNEVKVVVAILTAAADRAGLATDDLRGPAQNRAVSWPRQEAMLAIREATNYTIAGIGRIFLRRGVTTVYHGLRSAQGREELRVGGTRETMLALRKVACDERIKLLKEEA